MIVKETYKVDGMSCASCAISVETMLSSLQGVKHASVNYANSSALVEFDSEKTSTAEFVKAIDQIGYALIIPEADHEIHEEEKEKKKLAKAKQKAFLSLIISFPVFLFPCFFITYPMEIGLC